MSIKILCILPICINPINSSSYKGVERIQQYIVGLTKFFEYNEILNTHKVDIIIFDNTLNKIEELPEEIKNSIPTNVKIIVKNINNYGSKNKGSGLIECWRYLKNIIYEYDFLIHFEPRQLLLNFNFIQSFLDNPRNLFTYGEGNKHFNTGLFCMDCKILISFINTVNLDIMVSKYISIEYMIFDFFVGKKIPYFLKDKMELIWFPFLQQPIKM
jgi:hypothetical protein